MQARNDRGNHRAGDFVDDLPKGGIFLGWTTDHGKRPNSARPMINPFHVQNGKVMDEAVVAKMVPKRSFRQLQGGIDCADNTEIGLTRYGKKGSLSPIEIRSDKANGMTAQGTGKGQLRQALGQGHNRRKNQRGWPANHHIDAKRNAAFDGPGMVNANAAMDLIVQANLPVGLILIAGQLDTIHAQVGTTPAGFGCILAVNQGEGDEGTAIARPRLQLG